MKILVTGSAGFVGYHVAKRLTAEGHEVTGVDAVNDYYEPELKFDRLRDSGIDKDKVEWNTAVQSVKSGNYSFVRMNLKEGDRLNVLCAEKKFDVIIHLAAQPGVRYSISNPMAYVENNVVAFMNILECCRHHNVKHLIYASSSSVYGINSSVPFTETGDTNHPVSLYAATKKSNELMAYTYSHLYGFPATGLRFFTVYGPWGRPDMSPVLFAKAIAEHRPIKVFNHGNLSRDFTFIDDIVDGVVGVMHAPLPECKKAVAGYEPVPSRIFNIGNHQPVQLGHFIATLEKAMGQEAIKEMLPMQAGDVYETYASIEALHTLTGYTPSTTIEDGIPKFVQWFRSYYKHAE
jgi:UDP-glucuronate 4-epimerase